jgi:hypothetical protein
MSGPVPNAIVKEQTILYVDLVGGPPQGQQPARLTPWRPLQRVYLFWGAEHFSRGLTKNPIVVPKNCFFWLTFSSGETQCLSVAPFFLLKWLQSKISLILSDFFLWPPLPSCLSRQLLMWLCRKFAAGLGNNGYAMLQYGLSSSCRVAPRTETVLFC